jgi:NADPH:quinone reductase-like Zn-dependent oxidoreductase
MARAVAISSFGSPEVLQVIEVDPPQAGPGQVRVQIKAAGIQPADYAVRTGWTPPGLTITFPQILGNEFAGLIDQVGEGVTGFSVGDEVIGFQGLSGYAEYAAVSVEQIVAKPAGMPWEVAGGFSASAQTAHVGLEQLGVSAGDTVLIHGAAGGVGTVAVQLATLYGATVIGTASARNHDYLRELGAIPVTYGDGLVERVRAVAAQGVDAAFDAAGRGALEASVELVKDRGRIGTIVDYARVQELGVVGIRGPRTATRLAGLVDLYAQGKLRIEVAGTFPLERAADAHREGETGHVRGKIVLTVE